VCVCVYKTFGWRHLLNIKLRKTPRSAAAGHQRSRGSCCLCLQREVKMVTSTDLRNAGNLPQHYTASQRRKNRLESSPPWKSQMKKGTLCCFAFHGWSLSLFNFITFFFFWSSYVSMLFGLYHMYGKFCRRLENISLYNKGFLNL